MKNLHMQSMRVKDGFILWADGGTINRLLQARQGVVSQEEPGVRALPLPESDSTGIGMFSRTTNLQILATALLAAGSNSLHAHEWESRMDLLTAGAAASVIVFQVCAGDEAAGRAAQMASNQLLAAANNTGQAADAYRYAQAAYGLKIRAMWQSSYGQRCNDMQRMRDIAMATGFVLP